MKKKYRFFNSVHFKIPLVFVLLLIIFIEIIGGFFIRELENRTIDNFRNSISISIEGLGSTLSNELAKANTEKDDSNISRMVSNFVSKEIIEVRVVDDKGIVRANSNTGGEDMAGKKNDISYINDFNSKQKEIVDPATKKRELVSVEPIQSPTGEGAIGALYVRSDIESKYKEVADTGWIFLSGSLIAAIFSLGIALVVARIVTKPIAEMRHQAMKIARGDYSGEVKVYGQDELGELAISVNELSDRVEEAQEIVEAERNRLDSVLSHMTDGVVATDRRGKVMTINEMALELLDTTLEEATGKSMLELLKIDKEYTLRRLLEESNELLLDFTDSKGNQSMVKADFSTIKRESGFISGLVCVLHDVTEQEKNDQERRAFVSNVSHELRTPLTSMKSYLDALYDGAWEDPEVAPEFLRVTQEETDRMIRMINDLLNLSRMDAGNSNLQKELVNLNKMLGFVLDRFDMMVSQSNKKYRLIREFTKRSIWVEVDADKIIQVLDNILNNAIKYSPDGGQIVCRLLETHNNVVISVSDEGLGIPRKDLSHIFDRFYRVDKARSREMGGTGLGLAISKEVIKEHGGMIWVESVEGKGSNFYISLPYEPYEEELWE